MRRSTSTTIASSTVSFDDFLISTLNIIQDIFFRSAHVGQRVLVAGCSKSQ